MNEREAFLRRFHAEHPGITSAALTARDSYARLAAAVPHGSRVLDLGCGDDYLVSRLGPWAVGVDLAPSRVTGRGPRRGALVTGRAQALPFADRAFDACVCHLAFMLFDDLDAVVHELRRVVRPGGLFAAVVGGGPTADDTGDAFHAFLRLARFDGPGLGDRRASTADGWRGLFGVTPRFERFVVDLSGPLDDVWRFLGASYQLSNPDAVHAALAGHFADRSVVPCHVVMWLATVQL